MKRTLRARMLQERQALSVAVLHQASRQVTTLAQRIAPGAHLGVYWPVRREVPILAGLSVWRQRGIHLYLPALRGRDIVYQPWDFRKPLLRHALGMREPLGQGDASVVLTDVLVPVVAMTAVGGRLGMGWGCFDRWLVSHPRVHSVAVGYDFQLLDDLPIDSWDQACDEVWLIPT